MVIYYFLSLLQITSGLAGTGEVPAPFRDEVHLYLKKNCAECHGISQAPMFAVEDAESAYAAAKSIPNFDTTIINQSRNGHCGRENCSTENTDFIGAVQRWRALETIDKRQYTWRGSTQLPRFKKDQKSTRLWWNLRSLGLHSIPEHVKASMSVVVVKQNDYFIVKNLRVFLSHGTIDLEGIHVFQPDRILQIPELETGNFVIAASPQSTGFDMRPWDTGPQLLKNGITLALDRIQWRPDLSKCKALESFNRTVYPSFKRRACLQCHTQDPDAVRAWKMSSDSKVLCEQTKNRIDRNDFMNSSLVRASLGRNSEHGVLVPSISEINPGWTRWMEKEK